MTLIKRLWQDEAGQGMVEYGLILALIAVVAIVALRALGLDVLRIFNEVIDGLGGEPAS